MQNSAQMEETKLDDVKRLAENVDDLQHDDSAVINHLKVRFCACHIKESTMASHYCLNLSTVIVITDDI